MGSLATPMLPRFEEQGKSSVEQIVFNRCLLSASESIATSLCYSVQF